MIYKKLFSQASLNLLNASLAFMVTYLVINKISIGVVGEVYLIFAFSSLILLVNIILPPSFACLRLQDKRGFLALLITYQVYIQILILFLTLLFCFLLYSNNMVFSFFFVLYCMSLGVMNLADILLQARAKLDVYYKIQIYISLIKIIVLLLLAEPSWGKQEVFILLSMAQLIGTIIAIYKAFSFYDKPRNRVSFNFLFRYLKNAQPIIKHYYLTSVLKKLNDNMPALIFAPIVSSEVLGLFSLYQKSLTFGGSFLRSVESLLLNRNFMSKFNHMALLLVAPVCQLLMVTCGIGYFYFTVGVNISNLLLFSFLIYPLALTVFLRTRFLSNFKSQPMNVAMSITIVCFLLFCMAFAKPTLEFTLVAYSILIFLQASVLTFIYFLKRNKKGIINFAQKK